MKNKIILGLIIFSLIVIPLSLGIAPNPGHLCSEFDTLDCDQQIIADTTSLLSTNAIEGMGSNYGVLGTGTTGIYGIGSVHGVYGKCAPLTGCSYGLYTPNQLYVGGNRIRFGTPGYDLAWFRSGCNDDTCLTMGFNSVDDVIIKNNIASDYYCGKTTSNTASSCYSIEELVSGGTSYWTQPTGPGEIYYEGDVVINGNLQFNGQATGNQFDGDGDNYLNYEKVDPDLRFNGYLDCYDENNNAHPGQTEYFDTPYDGDPATLNWNAIEWDYNCDQIVEFDPDYNNDDNIIAFTPSACLPAIDMQGQPVIYLWGGDNPDQKEYYCTEGTYNNAKIKFYGTASSLQVACFIMAAQCTGEQYQYSTPAYTRYLERH